MKKSFCCTDAAHILSEPIALAAPDLLLTFDLTN